MKKLTTTTILLLITLLLTGCGSDEVPTDDSPGENSPIIHDDAEPSDVFNTPGSDSETDSSSTQTAQDRPAYLNPSGEWICYYHGEAMDQAEAQAVLETDWTYCYALITAHLNGGYCNTETQQSILQQWVEQLKSNTPSDADIAGEELINLAEGKVEKIQSRIEEIVRGEFTAPAEASQITHVSPAN